VKLLANKKSLMNEEVLNCFCEDKYADILNDKLLPFHLEENENDSNWKVISIQKRIKENEFTFFKWTARCQRCSKVYLYSIGVDLEADGERIIKIREIITQSKL
jgi:hypothetical protein